MLVLLLCDLAPKASFHLAVRTLCSLILRGWEIPFLLPFIFGISIIRVLLITSFRVLHLHLPQAIRGLILAELSTCSVWDRSRTKECLSFGIGHQIDQSFLDDLDGLRALDVVLNRVGHPLRRGLVLFTRVSPYHPVSEVIDYSIWLII